MKGIVLGMVIGGIFVFMLILIIGLSMNDQNITGNAINTKNTNQLSQNANIPVEQTILNETYDLKENMYISQKFEVYTYAKVKIDLKSEEFVNYVLLPDYEVEHYTKGESYKSYANSENILFIQDSYNLNQGTYSIVVTSKEKSTNVHLIIKAVELQ